MPNPYYSPLVVDLADGAQILNSTAEAIIVPDFSFAANDPRLYPGAEFHCVCYGDVTFVITTPGTITWRVRWGGVAGTLLAASGAYAPDPTSGRANVPYKLEFDLVWRTIGAAGSAFCMGIVQMNDVDDASATSLKGNLDMQLFGSAGANTPALVSSLATTSAQALSVTAQFSVSTATTQLTNHIRRLTAISS